jgi:spore germination protein KB
MGKIEKISAFQLFLWMLTFTFGDMTIINSAIGHGAGQDSWIGFCIGWAIGIILMMLYMAIIKLYPSRTIVEMLRDSFGKHLGTLLGICYIIYFTYAASLVVREFGEYIYLVNFPDTPIIYLMSILLLLATYAVRSGPEVIGRIVGILGIIFPIFILIVSLLLIPHLEFNNLLPVLEHDWKPILSGALSSVAFPFGELVIFMMIYATVNNNKNIKKAAFSSMMIGASIIFSALLRDIMVLGPELIDNLTFPAQTSSELIPDPVNISPLVAINLLIGSSVETSTYLYAITKGTTQLLNLEDYRPFVLPIAALLLILSMWNYQSIFEFFNSVSQVYVYFAVPFQVIIPFSILIISWTKKKSKKKKCNG